MARFAIIEGGHVANIAEASAEFAAVQGWIVAGNAAIGDLWDGIAFIMPPATPLVVPQSVTMRQARLALLAAGLLETVQTAINEAGPAARIEWDYAQEVQRSAGLVPQMATALGMTGEQIDALFVRAALL